MPIYQKSYKFSNKIPNRLTISTKIGNAALFYSHKCPIPHPPLPITGGRATRIGTRLWIWRVFLPHTDLTDENRLIYSADAAVLTRIGTRFLAQIGTTCGDMWKSVFLETRSGFWRKQGARLRLGLCSFRTFFLWQSVRYPYLIDLLDLREIIKNICVREQVTISISEADLAGGRRTPHRSLCSLCVVLTINQRLRGCAAVAPSVR